MQCAAVTDRGTPCRTVATENWRGVPFCRRHSPWTDLNALRRLNEELWAAVPPHLRGDTQAPEGQEGGE